MLKICKNAEKADRDNAKRDETKNLAKRDENLIRLEAKNEKANANHGNVG